MNIFAKNVVTIIIKNIMIRIIRILILIAIDLLRDIILKNHYIIYVIIRVKYVIKVEMIFITIV